MSKANFDYTNDGNTNRTFSQNPELSADIIEI